MDATATSAGHSAGHVLHEANLDQFKLLAEGQVSIRQEIARGFSELREEMGRRLDVPLPTTSITNEFLTAARGMGLAEKDFAILFEVLARMAGVGK